MIQKTPNTAKQYTRKTQPVNFNSKIIKTLLSKLSGKPHEPLPDKLPKNIIFGYAVLFFNNNKKITQRKWYRLLTHVEKLNDSNTIESIRKYETNKNGVLIETIITL